MEVLVLCEYDPLSQAFTNEMLTALGLKTTPDHHRCSLHPILCPHRLANTEKGDYREHAQVEPILLRHTGRRVTSHPRLRRDPTNQPHLGIRRLRPEKRPRGLL